MPIPIEALVVAAVVLSAMMGKAWALQALTGSSGWADVCWSFATGFAAVIIALWPGPEPYSARQLLVAGFAAFWAFRLGGHILIRTWGAPEDARYAALRQDWGASFQLRLFGFLQAQAVAGFPLAVAAGLAARNPAPGLQLADAAAAAVLIIAIFGEAVADAQLAAYRKSGVRGGVCERGLWGWSRHPNYFFEAMAWAAYPIFALAPEGSNLASGAWTLVAPVLIAWLLINVSGVPLLEAHMLRSRGDLFRDYQNRVSVFIPWPPKKRRPAA